MNAPPGPFGPPPSGSAHPANPYLQAPQGNPYAPGPQASPYPYAANPQMNPYAPPQAQGWVDPSAVSPDGLRPDVALYTSNNVALATFLGTPLGGAVLMAINERRLGRGGAAVKMLLAGLAGTAFLLGLGFILPENIPTFPFGIGSLFVMAQIAKSRQGAIVQRHLVAGGKRASGWAAAGIGLLCLVVVFVPLVAILVVAEMAAGH